MPRRSRATTIAEVARHAGVSPATVSRVMNGRFLGEPHVADRVRASAAELEYNPSPLARSLALGVTRTVAFVVPDLANPAFQAMLSGLSKTAARDGYRVLVADSAESPAEEPLLAAETRRRCDSIVLCAPRMPEHELVALEAQLHPMVLINRSSPRSTAPSLSVDYASGVRQLARHLYELGHRQLVYVQGPETSMSDAARQRGLEDFQGAAPDVRIDRIRAGATLDDGRAVADAVIATGATAALAYNDLVAIGLLSGLGERGVSVPRDLSVTGFDDIPFARYLTPPLTTASVPHRELGIEAWHRLHALIRSGVPEENVVVQPRLEIRGTTAPF
jgi:LacI family transcriptional regulator